MHHSLQIMFIFPVITGHLFWKATFMGSFYTRGSNISVSIIKIIFMTWCMNCTLNSRNSIINTYEYNITICNFQHWWSSDSVIFQCGVVIFISASIRNAFLHWLWLLNYFWPSPWMHYRLNGCRSVSCSCIRQNGYSIGSSSALKTFVTVAFTFVTNLHIFV